ncbi:MAG: hypothetical protein QOF17_643 [Solirubrobacteraceae bacterium]|jgi:hypothetical protein|nr:hypothetical protein [Solirubrobacteraceae bacterium]
MRRPVAMRRSVRGAAAVLVLALLLPAAPALAQSSPFGPLPQPAQTAAPAPTATPAGGATDTGTRTLLAIGGALLVVFVAIGVWIARDARRSIPQHHHARGARAMAEPDRGEPRPRRHDPKAKERAREKARAQRRARRHNRPGR